MSVGNVVVSQDAPAKNNLWIQPKGTARFWNGSIWKTISGSGGGGGGGDINWDSLITYDGNNNHVINLNYLPISLNSNTITIGTNSISVTPTSRTISTTNGLSGGGDLSQDRTIGIESNYKNALDSLISMFEIDSNGDVKTKDYIENGVTKHRGFYSPSFVSALGSNSSGGGGGGGMDIDAMWEALTTYDSTPSHIINNNYLDIRLQDLPVIPLNGNDVSGILPITKGGTGASDAAGARTNLGLGTMATESASDYLPLAGGTMTGNLNLKADQYNREGALNCNNSDIINVNSILTSDNAESFGEGICFYRSASTWDCLSANGGTFYFGSNKAYGAAFAGDAAIRCGNITTTAISGGDSSIRIKSANNTSIAFIGSGSSTPVSGGEYGIVQLYQNGTEMHRLYANPNDPSWLCYGSGNLGIGTNSPSYKLDVNGSGNFNGNLNLKHILYIGNGTYGSRIHIENNTQNTYFEIWRDTVNKLYFGYCDASSHYQYITLLSNGNIGISNTAPGYKLTVEGNIVASNTIGISQTAGSGDGISLYGGASSNPAYGLMFATTANYGTFGDLTGDYATYFTMDTTWGSKRGWAFRIKNTSTIVASLSTDGNFCAKGGVTALVTSSSDKRLKKNIKPFNATEIVDKLKPVQFEWNNKAKKYNNNFKDGKNYGLIAQDSDGIIDDLVFDLPDGKGYKGVRYEKLIPILLQAIKELKQEINDLKNK